MSFPPLEASVDTKVDCLKGNLTCLWSSFGHPLLLCDVPSHRLMAVGVKEPAIRIHEFKSQVFHSSCQQLGEPLHVSESDFLIFKGSLQCLFHWYQSRVVPIVLSMVTVEKAFYCDLSCQSWVNHDFIVLSLSLWVFQEEIILV